MCGVGHGSVARVWSVSEKVHRRPSRKLQKIISTQAATTTTTYPSESSTSRTPGYPPTPGYLEKWRRFLISPGTGPSSWAVRRFPAATSATKTVCVPRCSPKAPNSLTPGLCRTVHATQAISNVIKSSFGPSGLDKMMVDDIGVRFLTSLPLLTAPHQKLTRTKGRDSYE